MDARKYGLRNGAGFDQIDRAAQGMAQSLGKVEILVERCQAAVGIEFHEEVGVAGLRIEIRAARRRAEDFQPRYAVAPAELRQFLPLVSNGGVHGQPSQPDGKSCPSLTSS